MTLRVTCPNGHKLQVDSHHEGKKAACPRCDARFLLRAATPERRPVSDSSILAVLGNHDPSTSVISRPQAAAPARPSKACPKCQARFSAAYHICPSCRVYLGAA